MGKLFKLAVAALTAWQVHKMKNQLLDDVQSAEAQGKVNQGRCTDKADKADSVGEIGADRWIEKGAEKGAKIDRIEETGRLGHSFIAALTSFSG